MEQVSEVATEQPDESGIERTAKSTILAHVIDIGGLPIRCEVWAMPGDVGDDAARRADVTRLEPAYDEAIKHLQSQRIGHRFDLEDESI